MWFTREKQKHVDIMPLHSMPLPPCKQAGTPATVNCEALLAAASAPTLAAAMLTITHKMVAEMHVANWTALMWFKMEGTSAKSWHNVFQHTVDCQASLSISWKLHKQ